VPVSHDLYYQGRRNGVYAYFTYGVEPYWQEAGLCLATAESCFSASGTTVYKDFHTSLAFSCQTTPKFPFCAV
jgi:hypothetical protein